MISAPAVSTRRGGRGTQVQPREDECSLCVDDSHDVRPVLGGDGRIAVMALALHVGRCYGGAERLAFEFTNRLDPERFRRALCVIDPPMGGLDAINERDFAELEGSGVEVVRLARRSQLSVAPWGRLYRSLAGAKIDLLHCHMPRASVPGTIVGRLARVPVIVNHEHGWAFEGKPVRRFLDRKVVARGGDVLIAVSERDRQKMIDVEHIPPARIAFLPNGIGRPHPDGHDVRREFGVASDTGFVGAIGRLFPEKGHEDLIHAIALLKREHAGPIRCVIAGVGPERERLGALIGDLGVSEEVRLLGRRNDVPDLIRALDVAVLSSRREGSPLAVMEYMAGAAPIVATAVGGVPELIEDGVHGLLVKPGAPAELAAAIGTLLKDRPLASRLGQAAHERQLAKFDIDIVVRQLEGIYTELYERSLDGRRRR